MSRLIQPEPLLPPPSELGAPAKFHAWRKYQAEAILDIVASNKRFVLVALPTGSGKTLTGMVQQFLLSGRLAYLTSTKALQQQLMDDFEVSGLRQVKGQNAYMCRLAAEENYTDNGRPVTVDSGACHGGFRCKYMESGCGYFDAVNAAKSHDLVATNYSFFMTQAAYSQSGGLGKFDTLICDEGHSAVRMLQSFLAFAFDAVDAGRVGRKFLSLSAGLRDWRSWGKEALERVKDRLDALQIQLTQLQETACADRKLLRGMLHEIHDLKDLTKRLTSLTDAEGDWVIDFRDRYVRFDPLRPARYAERCLFLGIKKVIIMSATLTVKDGEQLDIPTDEMDYFEYPSTFPVERRPVYRIPTVSVKFDTPEDKMRKWDMRIDQIIGSRLDRKGIIHAHSYKLAQRIQKNSQYSDILIVPTRDNTRAKVEQFKAGDPPLVLVSPAVTTGFDFPDQDARFQIIAKVPFPTTDSAVIKAWRELDPDYAFHLAMQTITQSYGRSTRSESDFSETFVVDDNFSWFISQYGCKCGRPLTCTRKYHGKPCRHFAPKYFLDAIIWCDSIPEPPSLKGDK
jgi:Rad3-related DNA helicase